jgi:hypothetical protein
VSPAPDRPKIAHDLVFTLNRVRDWADAERQAARYIRQYTCAKNRDPDAELLLHVTSIEAVTHSGRLTWTAVVRAEV